MSQTVPLKEKFWRTVRRNVYLRIRISSPPPFPVAFDSDMDILCQSDFLSWGRLWTIALFFQSPHPRFFFPLLSSSSLFDIFLPPQNNDNNRISFCPVRFIPLYFRVELRVLGLISKCCIWFRGDTDDAVISGRKINMAFEAVAKERKSSLFKAFACWGIWRWSSRNILFYWSALFVLWPLLTWADNSWGWVSPHLIAPFGSNFLSFSVSLALIIFLFSYINIKRSEWIASFLGC